MKKLFLISSCCLLMQPAFSQTNCSNPVSLLVCPSVVLTNQTNGGMIDDSPGPCNIAGEDLVYEIVAPNGAQQLFISVVNATAGMQLSVEADTCGGSGCNTLVVGPGNSNVYFNLAAAGFCYVWIDAPTTVFFSISFGADTGSVFVNIPNTQGTPGFDSSGCATPPFNLLKPFYQVRFNSVAQTNPMTLAPLFVQGTMCITTFFRNTTGVEGLKRFEFDFNPFGYDSVSPLQGTFPGFYNAGNWVASQSGSKWIFIFADAAGTGKGDFTGIPDSCLTYSFCFNMTPLSNSPQLTNVKVNLLTDGFGAGFSGWVISGCCPLPKPNCLSGSMPGVSASAQGFGFAFDDPGGALPVVLLGFTAVAEGGSALIEWTTASESNNDFFTVERSTDAYSWFELGRIDGAGNSNLVRHYRCYDRKPLSGSSYYRLRQTDFNGLDNYFPPEQIYFGDKQSIYIWPNPAADYINISGKDLHRLSVAMINATGQVVDLQGTFDEGNGKFNTGRLPAGLYLLVVYDGDDALIKQRVSIIR